jgi:secreted trypsin-like serine protease
LLGINYLYYPKSNNATPRWANVSHFCGGVLVSNINVLTAAHCLFKRKIIVDSIAIDLQENVFHETIASIFTVYIGVFNQEIDKQDNRNVYKIESITLHKDFDRTNLLNDIGLLKLMEPVKKTIKTDYICLPNFNINVIQANDKLYAVGFGLVASNSLFSSNLLRQVDLKMYPFETCNNTLSEIKSDSTSQLCVGDLTQSKDTCQGDSGSPLMYNYMNRWYVIGIVSYGRGCGIPEYPGIKSR